MYDDKKLLMFTITVVTALVTLIVNAFSTLEEVTAVRERDMVKEKEDGPLDPQPIIE